VIATNILAGIGALSLMLVLIIMLVLAVAHTIDSASTKAADTWMKNLDEQLKDLGFRLKQRGIKPDSPLNYCPTCGKGCNHNE